jgi:3-hydroxy acid dehydrogenase / malonic semialdehyde reductase
MSVQEQWASGRVALITGATSGFGAAFAQRIAAAGGRVVAVGRRAERLQALVDQFGADVICPRAVDLQSRDAPAQILDGLPAAFADIDSLINNAGLALGLGPAQKADLANWETMMAVNVQALVRLTHALLPRLIARPRADIINLSSVAARYPYPGGNVYAASKAFVRQFSLGLRSDLLGTGVRVTSLEPGMCETEFSLVRFAGDPAAAAKVYEGMRPLSAEDVAAAMEAVLRLPAHLNVNIMEIMPIQQAFGPFAVDRSGAR